MPAPQTTAPGPGPGPGPGTFHKHSATAAAVADMIVQAVRASLQLQQPRRAAASDDSSSRSNGGGSSIPTRSPAGAHNDEPKAVSGAGIIDSDSIGSLARNLEADDLGRAASRAHQTLLLLVPNCTHQLKEEDDELELKDESNSQPSSASASSSAISIKSAAEQERQLVRIIREQLLVHQHQHQHQHQLQHGPPVTNASARDASADRTAHETTARSARGEGNDMNTAPLHEHAYGQLLSQLSTLESRVLIRLYHSLLFTLVAAPAVATSAVPPSAPSTQNVVPSLLEIGRNRHLPWFVREEALRCLRKDLTPTSSFATSARVSWNDVIRLVEGHETEVVEVEPVAEGAAGVGNGPEAFVQAAKEGSILLSEGVMGHVDSASAAASAATSAAETTSQRQLLVPAQVRSAALTVLTSHRYTPALSRLESIIDTEPSSTIDSKHPPKLVGWYDGVRQLTLARAVLGDVGCYTSVVTRLYDPTEKERAEAGEALDAIVRQHLEQEGKDEDEGGVACGACLAEIARLIILHDDLLDDERGEFPHFVQRSVLSVAKEARRGRGGGGGGGIFSSMHRPTAATKISRDRKALRLDKNDDADNDGDASASSASAYASFSSAIGPPRHTGSAEDGCSLFSSMHDIPLADDDEEPAEAGGCSPLQSLSSLGPNNPETGPETEVESEVVALERQIWEFLRNKHWNECVVRWAGENLRKLNTELSS